MALRPRNPSPSSLSTLNPQSTCHGPRPGPKLASGVRAGSLRATELRARGKTRGLKRNKCRRAKKTHTYIYSIRSTNFFFVAPPRSPTKETKAGGQEYIPGQGRIGVWRRIRAGLNEEKNETNSTFLIGLDEKNASLYR